jgi:hypothetical protein
MWHIVASSVVCGIQKTYGIKLTVDEVSKLLEDCETGERDTEFSGSDFYLNTNKEKNESGVRR